MMRWLSSTASSPRSPATCIPWARASSCAISAPWASRFMESATRARTLSGLGRGGHLSSQLPHVRAGEARLDGDAEMVVGAPLDRGPPGPDQRALDAEHGALRR